MRNQAEALIRYGSLKSWPDGTPDYDIGTRFDMCSWPVWDQQLDQGTSTIRIWRNPDFSRGDIWYEPKRFGTIEVWKGKKATGFFPLDYFRQLKQWQLDLEAARKPLIIPWGKGWRGDEGIEDNGVIVKAVDGTSYEILGLHKLGAASAGLINLRLLADPRFPFAYPDDYRCDFVRHRRPPGHKNPTQPVDTQGPQWREDGLLTPAHLKGMVDSELRLMIFNPSFGPDAKPYPPGWTEHPKSKIPFAKNIKREPGSTDKSVDCYQPFGFRITDAGIEAWLKSLKDPSLDEARRWFARNLRGYASDAQEPKTIKSTMRVCASGSGTKLLESVGWANPRHRVEWAQCGILTSDDARNLGKNLFLFGVVTEIPRPG